MKRYYNWVPCISPCFSTSQISVHHTQYVILKIFKILISKSQSTPEGELFKLDRGAKLENVIFLNPAIPRRTVWVTGCTKRYEIIYINKHSCFLNMFS